MEFNEAELENLEKMAEDTMLDECYILRSTTEQNVVGEEEVTYDPDDTPIACGWRPTGSKQRILPDMSVVDIDAIVRLPRFSSVDVSCQLRLVRRYGREVAPEDYEIVSEPRVGPSAIQVEVKKVEL